MVARLHAEVFAAVGASLFVRYNETGKGGMGKFVKGDMVVTPYPFSDLSRAKRPPALVVAGLPGDDVILCQIPSKAVTDNLAITIASADFASGGLDRASNVYPNCIFTADSNIITLSRRCADRREGP